MRHARYHVLVVDHSKFGKVRPARMGALAKFDVIASDICPDDELVALAKAQQISYCIEASLPAQARQASGEPAAEPAVQFHQHEVDHPAEEAALFTDSMTISGRCSMVLSFSLKSIVPTTCPFSSGAVSCG